MAELKRKIPQAKAQKLELINLLTCMPTLRWSKTHEQKAQQERATDLVTFESIAEDRTERLKMIVFWTIKKFFF